MINKSVQIYCDGGTKSGYGHISRSLALKKYFDENQLRTSIYGINSASNKLLGSKKFKNNNADIILFDSHRNIEKSIRNEISKNKLVITLDWFGSELPHYNIVIFPHKLPGSIIKNYIGFEYIILRDDILKLNNNKSENKALVCIGGGDILNQGYLAADYLHQIGFQVTLVKGPSYKGSILKKKYRILQNPKNFNEVLSTSNLVITNGGGCLFESLYLDIPVFVLPQTKYEENLITYSLLSKQIIGFGIENLELISKKNIIPNKSNLIDGLGKNRIFKIIKSLL